MFFSGFNILLVVHPTTKSKVASTSFLVLNGLPVNGSAILQLSYNDVFINILLA